ncbi:MAG: hypothetical protein Q8P67_24050 [archaeon]|nr:hypothetical protein [archaeon]
MGSLEATRYNEEDVQIHLKVFLPPKRQRVDVASSSSTPGSPTKTDSLVSELTSLNARSESSRLFALTL